MKILFVSRLFQDVSGGVERMAIALMNDLCTRGHSVELMSWDRVGAKTYYPLDPCIVWHCLDMGDARENAGWSLRLRRQLAIRRLVRRVRPDVLIAFQHGPFLTVATAISGSGIPVIAAERNAPQRFDHLRAGKHRALIFPTFLLADRITVQWDDYISGYPPYLHSRIVSIPNPVPVAARLANAAGGANEVRQLLCVGRLSYQKNQSVLIDAFSQLAGQYPQWRLMFVGAGEDEQRLKKLAAKLGLSERIKFTGAVSDVESQYFNSHLFCLPSRWEGFPNAMAEAMAHGLPAVGFSDCAGMAQLIDDGVTGCLVTGNGSADKLANVLRSLMNDDEGRARMGQAAVVAMTRYLPVTVFDRWEMLFHEVAMSR